MNADALLVRKERALHRIDGDSFEIRQIQVQMISAASRYSSVSVMPLINRLSVFKVTRNRYL